MARKKRTKNQQEYIRRVRNALRAVKRRLSSPIGGRIIISDQVLPISFDKYNKGARLTDKEILKAAPDRITKKDLEEVATRNVIGKLEFVDDEGNITTASGKEYWNGHTKKSAHIPTEYEMLMDKIYAEFGSLNNVGDKLVEMIKELEKTYGADAISYIFRKYDTDDFWRMVEQEEYYGDAIQTFRQQLIDDLPGFFDKKKLKEMADNGEYL